MKNMRFSVGCVCVFLCVILQKVNLFSFPLDDIKKDQQNANININGHFDDWKPGELEELEQFCYKLLRLLILRDDPRGAVVHYFYLEPLGEKETRFFGPINDIKNRNLVIELHVAAWYQIAIPLLYIMKTTERGADLGKAYTNSIDFITKKEDEITDSYKWGKARSDLYELIGSAKSESEISSFLLYRKKIVSQIKKKLSLNEHNMYFPTNYANFIANGNYHKKTKDENIYYQITFANLIEVDCIKRKGADIRVIGIGLME